MTMDANHRIGKQSVDSEVQLLNNNDEVTTKVAPIKRSFDVAFLMLPDDKLKQKQLRAARQTLQEHGELLKASSNYLEEDEDRRSDADSPLGALSEMQKIQSHAKYLHSIAHLGKHQQIFGDPNLGKASSATKSAYDNDDEDLLAASTATVRLKLAPEGATQQKSAFTKVNNKEPSQMSPNLSLSPDLSYQNSLSPSPPILRHQYQAFHSPNMHVSPNHFKSVAYQNCFLQENLGFSSQHHQIAAAGGNLVDGAFLLKTNHQEQLPNFSTKIRPVLQYRPDFPPYAAAYPAFPPQEMLKMGAGDGRGPTAATIFSSLLPPSLAALSLPAQNVCAKCNISFRMTSDLVYHMRSHHKNDVANDMSKRRREEKLKCPVCAESFRERHHLTRHMTAHQDKEGDVLDGEEVHKKKGASAAGFGAFNK